MMMGGGVWWGWGVVGVHIQVAWLRGLPDACGGVFSGVGWVCSVCVSCMICGLMPVGCWGLSVSGDLL